MSIDECGHCVHASYYAYCYHCKWFILSHLKILWCVLISFLCVFQCSNLYIVMIVSAWSMLVLLSPYLRTKSYIHSRRGEIRTVAVAENLVGVSFHFYSLMCFRFLFFVLLAIVNTLNCLMHAMNNVGWQTFVSTDDQTKSDRLCIRQWDDWWTS